MIHDRSTLIKIISFGIEGIIKRLTNVKANKIVFAIKLVIPTINKYFRITC